jgi:hypothetical protein
MHCVHGEYGFSEPGPFCVSNSVPTPICCNCSADTTVWQSGAVEGYPLICVDSQIMGTWYGNQRTGIMGWERTTCPNGCEATGANGWGQTPGACRP